MATFTFRHYWHSEDYAARIEPEWISYPDEALSSEQKRWKQVARKLLDPTKYSQLADAMPESEILDGYYIYYRYEQKEDPDPSNNRNATNITFCLSTKKVRPEKCDWHIRGEKDSVSPSIQHSTTKWLLIGSVLLLLLLVYWGTKVGREVASAPRATKTEVTEANSKKVEAFRKSDASREQQPPAQNVISTKSAGSTLCRSDMLQSLLEKPPTYCYEAYMRQRCAGETEASYDRWLQEASKRKELFYRQCALIKKGEEDRDLKVWLRSRSAEQKSVIRDFMRGGAVR
jgi:Sec-independent protein translocase protein TatA